MESPQKQEMSDAVTASSSTHLNALLEKIEKRSARMGIIGQG